MSLLPSDEVSSGERLHDWKALERLVEALCDRPRPTALDCLVDGLTTLDLWSVFLVSLSASSMLVYL
jgi:hypothetical protein